jgi:hypothetical protein
VALLTDLSRDVVGRRLRFGYARYCDKRHTEQQQIFQVRDREVRGTPLPIAAHATNLSRRHRALERDH